jgi:hypothetical protein
MISLRSLYDAYNTCYWADHLPPYAIRRKRLPGLHGQCDRRRRIIGLDLRKIHNGEALRRTLLHEMCRAADCSSQELSPRSVSPRRSGRVAGDPPPPAGRGRRLKTASCASPWTNISARNVRAPSTKMMTSESARSTSVM